ncbi:MAG: hypothetical protein AB1508_18950 [Pseudomonadota bacterium]
MSVRLNILGWSDVRREFERLETRLRALEAALTSLQSDFDAQVFAVWRHEDGGLLLLENGDTLATSTAEMPDSYAFEDRRPFLLEDGRPLLLGARPIQTLSTKRIQALMGVGREYVPITITQEELTQYGDDL